MTPGNSKSVLLAVASATSNTSTSATVDTLGFNFCRINLYTGVSNIPAVLAVDGGDTTSSFPTNIGLTGGTNFTIATNNTNATTSAHYTFDIDSKGLPRYLRIRHTPAAAVGTNAHTVVMVADLGRPATGVVTAAQAGANNYLTVPS